MIMGILSDTHEDRMNALPHIIEEFKRREVEIIIHCGDIEPLHLKAELFGGLPVFCALIEEQQGRKEFEVPPVGWIFTRPGQRIIKLGESLFAYLGHKRSFGFLKGSEIELDHMMHEIRSKSDWVRWLFSGHTHHQIYKQGHLTSFVNPGAVEDSFDGYEFAVINTIDKEIVFCRIPQTSPVRPDFSVGVISDSLNISELDPGFWQKLSEEFRDRGVKYIIHCGNIIPSDIGRNELSSFQVFYNLRPDQKNERSAGNWHQISIDSPIVEIEGYKFYVQLDLGADLLEKSEIGMHKVCLDLRRKYPEISFVLCGFTNDAFLEEGQEVRIVNPGDILKDRNFAVICLPRTEITFGHVPVDPLPPL
jgi:predicted phosphodiesterase